MKIQLTCGHCVEIDDCDFDLVSSHKWGLHRGGGGHLYASRTDAGKCILMHREILQVDAGFVVDHINGDGLDNRRCNIRVCTQSQNIARVPQRAGVSGFRGVRPPRRKRKRYVSVIKVNGRRRHIGTSDTAFGAAMLYDQEAKRIFGEFAALNFEGT